MAETYTKLFNTIITSSVWSEDDKTRILWITMLALADFNGKVEGSLRGLADMARMDIDDCKRAAAKLMSPDEYSRTKDHDGRRIAEVDGGWLIINHEKYRNKGGSRAEYYRKYRRDKKDVARNNAQPSDTQTETDTETDTYIKKKNKKKGKDKYRDFVFLSKEEHEKLKTLLGGHLDDFIERLDGYIGSTGKKYKSHYHTIRNWHKRENPPPRPEKKIPKCKCGRRLNSGEKQVGICILCQHKAKLAKEAV